MMRKSSDVKAAIDKLKRLKALQAQATEKLNRISQEASGKPPKKKKAKSAPKTKPSGRKKAGTTVKKGSLWQWLFGSKTEKRNKPKKVTNKK